MTNTPRHPKPRTARMARRVQSHTLDTAVTKVGQDFPAIGALMRQRWTGAA